MAEAPGSNESLFAREPITMLRPPRVIEFDPNNREHLKAFSLLYLHGRQHPKLRFDLPDGFTDVPTYMAHMLLTAVIPDDFKTYPLTEDI